jgi:hypothetical protein
MKEIVTTGVIMLFAIFMITLSILITKLFEDGFIYGKWINRVMIKEHECNVPYQNDYLPGSVWICHKCHTIHTMHIDKYGTHVWKKSKVTPKK